MWPAAHLSGYGPGGFLGFAAITIVCIVAALLYTKWKRRKDSEAWKKALKESRENKKPKG